MSSEDDNNSFEPERFGKFLLTEKVGEGGMAEVFRARTAWVEGVAKEVCIKRILPPLSADQQLREMFVQEARIAVSLSHANIVPVFEFGIVDEYYFLSMEFVDGYTIRDIMMQSARQRRWLPTPLALHVIHEALEGLDYAHRKRDSDGRRLAIVHRDMTPGNVMGSVEGEVKILDFGIAAIGQAGGAQLVKGRGKPGYMAPEQAVGMAVDARADIFSVAVMLYELLTHRRLFKGKDPAKTPVVAPSRLNSNVPQSLDHVVLKALSPAPSERYASAGEFRDAIHDYMHEHGLRGGRSQLATALAALFEHEVRAPRPRASYDVKLRAPRTRRKTTTGLQVKVGDATLAEGTPSRRGLWITLVMLLLAGGAAALYFLVLKP